MQKTKIDKNAIVYQNHTIDVNKSAILTSKYSEI